MRLFALQTQNMCAYAQMCPQRDHAFRILAFFVHMSGHGKHIPWQWQAAGPPSRLQAWASCWQVVPYARQTAPWRQQASGLLQQAALAPLHLLPAQNVLGHSVSELANDPQVRSAIHPARMRT